METMTKAQIKARQEAIAMADAHLNNAALPTYSQLLVLVTQGVDTKARKSLEEDARLNPSATDCGTFVIMTPAAWAAISKACNAIDA